MALTQAERAAIELVFMRGPASLLEDGWGAEQIAEFLTKPEVRTCLEAMLVEFGGQEVTNARVRYGLRRGVTRLAPDALKVFQQALAGPQYLRNKSGKVIVGLHGPIVEEPQPTSNQLRASLELLDRLGLPPESRDVHRERAPSTLNVNALVGSPVDVKVIDGVVSEKGTHEQRVLSRERVRGVIDALTKKLPELRAKLLPSPKVPKVPKKAKIKAKAE